jgi:7-carboxy-7-deazaguanine synthase
MLISEVFYSIQGEGILAGVPSVFIRTTGCNLRCSWCDSKYASWDSEGREMTVDEVLNLTTSHATRFCVITGGEPMLAKGIHTLAQRLAAADKHITIETAATTPPDGIACSLASLSPKLGNSTPGSDVSATLRERHETLRLQPDVIRAWIDNYDYQLKFVISSGSDVEEVVALVARLDREIPPEKVLLMPQGVDSEALSSVADLVVAACKEHRFRFCDRLHLRLFGNKRGT